MVRKRPIKPDPISAGRSVTHVCCRMYRLSKVGEKPALVTAMKAANAAVPAGRSAPGSGLLLTSFPSACGDN